MLDDGLTPAHRAILRKVLAPFAQEFERVGLFGSRAAGKARPESDIDLVVYGAEDPELVDRLFTLFGESRLPMTVDVVDYDRTDYPPLKAHIDQVMQPLFECHELMASVRPT